MKLEKRVFFKLLWVLLAFLPQYVGAQDKLFNISVGGGFDDLLYTQEMGRRYVGGNVMLEGQYQQFFSKKLGYAVGVQFSYFAAGCDFKDIYEKSDEESDVVFYGSVYEKQRFLQIDVPVLFNLRHKINLRSHFFFGVGPKLSFPLISKFEYVTGSLGNGNNINTELLDVSPDRVDEQNENKWGDIDTEILIISLSMDVKWSYAVNNSCVLHIGAYFSYGLNDLVSNHDAQFGFDNKSILNATITGKVTTICAGLKMGVTFPLQRLRRRSIAYDGF